MTRWIVLAALALAAGAHAQADPTPGQERARVRAERSQIDARKAAEEAACRQRFAINDCLAEVRQRWREPLADLKRQERVINEQERKQRSAQQLKELDERRSPATEQAAAERRERALADQQDREARAQRKASGPQPQGAARAPRAAAAGSAGISPEQASANARAHEERVRQAQEHKDAVLQRQARSSRKAASALPVP